MKNFPNQKVIKNALWITEKTGEIFSQSKDFLPGALQVNFSQRGGVTCIFETRTRVENRDRIEGGGNGVLVTLGLEFFEKLVTLEISKNRLFKAIFSSFFGHFMHNYAFSCNKIFVKIFGACGAKKGSL